MELLKKEETAPPPENSSPKLASNFRRQAWEDEDDSLGPLPPNWQKAVTPSGKPCFINHSTQSTTWDDPRRHRKRCRLVEHSRGSCQRTTLARYILHASRTRHGTLVRSHTTLHT